ncbi:hypothetical protein OSK38_29295, partial [Escherichia coli]|nr:hypothetical protein [Escherichia coli]
IFPRKKIINRGFPHFAFSLLDLLNSSLQQINGHFIFNYGLLELLFSYFCRLFLKRKIQGINDGNILGVVKGRVSTKK